MKRIFAPFLARAEEPDDTESMDLWRERSVLLWHVHNRREDRFLAKPQVGTEAALFSLPESQTHTTFEAQAVIRE